MLKDFKISILISGRGSNMQSLIEHAGSSYSICNVAANTKRAAGLEFASARGLPTYCFEKKDFSSRLLQLEKLFNAIESEAPDLICLAGFMQILPPEIVEPRWGRIVNIHPSLLPEFSGLDTHQRALKAGKNQHGCSVHFVDSGVDTGPVIAQARCEIAPAETEVSLALKVLKLEHQLYPWVVSQLAAGEISLDPAGIRYSASARESAAANKFMLSS